LAALCTLSGVLILGFEFEPGLVLFPIIMVVAVVAIIAGHAEQRRRREAMAAVAARLGLSFLPGNQGSPMGRPYELYSEFRSGRSRRLSNLMRGTVRAGSFLAQVVAGDYQYTTGSGKSQTTHRLSFVIVQLPCVWAPRLTIRPEHFGDRIASAMGFDDIDFESEEFSRKFHVSGPDKRFAYDVCSPEMMEWLLRLVNPPTIELERGAMMLHKRGRWRPEEFPNQLGLLGKFVELWPEHIVRSLMPESPQTAEPALTAQNAQMPEARS
jgi:hypothetical protein